jgi:hypothetical protein
MMRRVEQPLNKIKATTVYGFACTQTLVTERSNPDTVSTNLLDEPASPDSCNQAPVTKPCGTERPKRNSSDQSAMKLSAVCPDLRPQLDPEMSSLLIISNNTGNRITLEEVELSEIGLEKCWQIRTLGRTPNFGQGMTYITDRAVCCQICETSNISKDSSPIVDRFCYKNSFSDHKKP